MGDNHRNNTPGDPPISPAQAQIRALLEGWSVAVREQDLDRLMAYYAPDIVAYDAIMELQFKGADAYRKHWEFCLGLCGGGMVFEQHQVTVYADEHVAFAHWLNRCGGADETGEVKASWMRASAGYRKTDDGWKAVHEHFSAPFDMASGKALFELQP
jgi:ketosteroid isomerase-like protein